jgi:GMP synthase (glutamine-hydrolysing)
LLGSFLGAPITNRYNEPVSCASVRLTPEGKQDPLLKGFPDRIDVLLGHKEACDITPAGTALLLKGDACPVQMFRIGRKVYATQFHPEGDVEGFELRIQVYRHHGYFEPHEAERLIAALKGKQTPYAQEILKRFINLARETD